MKSTYIGVLLFIFCIVLPLEAQVVINEFLASNNNAFSDEAGEFDDWVELYNPGDVAFDIGGLFLSDNIANPTLHRIADNVPELTTIPPNGYLLLWFDKDTLAGPLHIGAKLSAGGEDIVLTAADGLKIIDSYTFGEQSTDVSEGRETDGAEDFVFFSVSTPNESNEGANIQITPPIFSVMGGHQNDSVSVSLNHASQDVVIYYTTDGADPDTLSSQYNGPITLKKTTSLRALAIDKYGGISRTVTHTYLINVQHTFPIVALAGDPENFFDSTTGIFGNTSKDIEIIVNVEFYETDGTLGFNHQVVAELNGSASVANTQKSIALKAKRSIGESTFDYPIFPNVDKESYKSLVLRNSGQDWPITGFRDAAVSSLVRDLSDVGDLISPPQLLTQGYRPSICYLNGEYWGIYNIRERIDKGYVKNHYKLDEEEFDFIHNREIVKVGDIENWQEFMDFLDDKDFSDDENFDKLSTWVDTDAYMDYMIFNLFIDNQDWPGNNYRRFRERNDSAQWQFFTYDLDFSFGLFTGQVINSGFPGLNTLDGNYNIPMIKIYPYNEWGTRVFRRLADNEMWRHKFFNRASDQLNTLFKPQRVIGRIDSFLALYAPEMVDHIDKWNVPQAQSASADKMKFFATERVEIFRNHFLEVFEDVSKTAKIAISSKPAKAGTIHFSSLNIEEEEDNTYWEGTYFQHIDIPVSVTPNPGYLFAGWSGISDDTTNTITVNLRDTTNKLVANFIQGDTSNFPLVINEINYHSSLDNNHGDWLELYNPNSIVVDISGWYVQDEAGNYFNFPLNTIIESQSYLTLVEDELLFGYMVDYVIGSFGDKSPYPAMKFGNDGEKLALYNAAGRLIDEVDYDDQDPWPIGPDGNGKSLQLSNVSLDNNLASSWSSWDPTPSAVNQFTTTISTTKDSKERIIIYPNPTTSNSKVFIAYEGIHMAQNAKVTLHNILGNEVSQAITFDDTGEGTIELNIGELPGGTYLLSLIQNVNHRHTRLITIL